MGNIYIAFWYIKKAAQAGGKAVYKKYGCIGGDPNRRKQLWYKWWNTTGRFCSSVTKRKEITIPKKDSLLAEFVGIMIGDGAITQRQICITLNRESDHFYVLFVQGILKKLFNTEASLYKSKGDKSVDIFISRTNLVNFCRDIGLKIGHKIRQKLDIPDWIKSNPDLMKACIRGIFDTDGCVAIHRYQVNKKHYTYKKLIFSSASSYLIKTIINFLSEFRFNPRLSKSGRQVWLDDQDDVRKYMDIVGTSNKKHKERFYGEVGERLKPAGC